MSITDINSIMNCFAGMTGRPVPEEERRILSSLCTVKLFPPKRVLLHLDDIPGEYYYICKGLCRQYYIDGSGSDITRGFTAEGGFCCTEALIEADRARYCVETLEECRVLAFRPRDMTAQLADSVYMRDVYINALIKNIRVRMKREEMFLTCSALERYQLFTSSYPELVDRVKQIHLASYLGINQVTLSRARRALREGLNSTAV
jgi:CRP-like cAMP-binding protein